MSSTNAPSHTEERALQAKYWADHSTTATLETMMLDSQAAELDALERPEIMSHVPEDLRSARVLELGAGIGRFTSMLAERSGHVHAVDFMENLIKENERLNGHMKNTSYQQADVTEMEIAENSYDFVFSNWLFMYLNDSELTDLAARLLKSLKPGGHLFFRESCFRQSGDRTRAFNPSHYRTMSAYSVVFEEARAGAGATGKRFQLVRAGCVSTYVAKKGNPGQLYWLWRCVPADQPISELRPFLDAHQYSEQGLSVYERVFGQGFISTGGKATLERLAGRLQLQEGSSVLDCGCGVGGGAFFLAETFGAHVRGVELSNNAVSLALQRAAERTKAAREGEFDAGRGRATFECCDMTERVLGTEVYDAALSRDSLLHVADKPQLLKRIHKALKPGGRLLLTDYCLGGPAAAAAPSGEFAEYIQRRGYHLLSIEGYAAALRASGFEVVSAEDSTADFLADLKRETEQLRASEAAFAEEFGEEAFAATLASWEKKAERAGRGEQVWGVFMATKK